MNLYSTKKLYEESSSVSEYLQKFEEAGRRYQARMKLIENSHAEFLKTEGYFVFDPDGSIPSAALYELYRQWCIQEELPIKPAREFCLRIKKEAPFHAMTYSGNIINKEGKRCRGFRGIRTVNG